MDLVVYRVKSRDTGQTAFMSQDEIDSSNNPEEWEKIKPVFETRETKFLEVTGKRAVELELAEGLASNRDELSERYPSREDWIELQWNNVDWAVLILNHPIVTGLLFVVAMIALYIEFASPGIGVGGLTALLCFSLFFWSRFLGGTAEWLEVILFLSGLALIGVEVFVIPGFGVWGITGLLLLASSLVMASEPFLIPKTEQDLSSLTRTLATVLGSGVICLVLAAWLTSRMGKIPLLNRFALAPPGADSRGIDGGPSTDGFDDEVTVQVGQHGTADSPLRPAGKIRVGDQFIDVVSDGTFVEVGETVRVVAVRGNHVVVRRVDSS
jgi:membrane-bound serine protease (ClpP class)